MIDLDQAAKQGIANKMANCDRVNAAANRLISLYDVKDPVLYYWTTEGNHNTGLVGDPRMPKYGEKNSIVMDAYAVFPMPHSLAEASYDVRIPHEGEEDHADLEIQDYAQRNANPFNASHFPEPVSGLRQQEWLKAQQWPTQFGADVVKAWHQTELRETGKEPDRWSYLFTCKDPSVRYGTATGPHEAFNQFPTAYAGRRVDAFLQLNQQFHVGKQR